MIFEFTPVAEASVVTLMKSINKVIINPIIFFLFALALVYFLYGVAQYLLNPESEEVRKNSKTHMLYGIFGLFIMVAVFGIMNLILNTVGERNRIKIQPTGDYEIVNRQKYIFDEANENDFNSSPRIEVDTTSPTGQDISETKNLTKFDTSPFAMKYVSNPLCWRKEISFKASTEYSAINGVKDLAIKTYLIDNNLSSAPNNTNYPLNFGILTSFDREKNVYVAWIDARAPLNNSSPNNCVLQSSRTTEFSLQDYVLGDPFSSPRYMSTGPSPFTNMYESDNLFIRIIASGVNAALRLAREIAIKNAFALLGIEVQDVNTLTVVYPTARILEEKYVVNPQTGNYEYWVAVESGRMTTTVSNSTKVSPFTKTYESDSLFGRVVDYAVSKNPSTAKDLAINSAVLKLSKVINPNDMYRGVQLMIILEEKQIFNENTGEYEYWVAVEGSKSVEGSKPTSQSPKVAPFTKVYKTDAISFKAVDSGVSKNLSTAKDLAINNALIKLGIEVGNSLTGAQLVNILEEKELFNSITGNYEYWVAVEVKK